MRSSGSMRAQIGTLIVATSAIQLANGFFGTFISLRVGIEGFNSTVAGLVLSSYFAGFILGALRCGRIIERIGHIRAYAAFAGLAVAATAAMPLLIKPLSWLVLRAVVGFGCAGLFVTTESWLNAKTEPSLVPAWMQDEGIAHTTIALVMLAAVLGGLAFQVPVGRLSDRLDRRLVLAALAVAFAVIAVAVVLLPHSLPVVLPLGALLGGFMSTLYPVCVAQAHDRTPADRVVAVSGQLILISGLGSVVGPLMGASVMGRFDIDGAFYLMAAAALLLALLAAGSRLTRAAPTNLDRPFGILAPQAARLAHGALEPSDDAAV